MRKALSIAAAGLLALQAAPAGQSSQPGPATYAAAYEAWDRGEYVAALEGLKALVPGSDQATFEEIALLTGELYETAEVTADGRAPAFSADGSLIIYETGPLDAPETRVVRAAAGFPAVASFAGTGAVLDRTASTIAFKAAGAAPGLGVRAIGSGAGDTVQILTPSIPDSLVWSADGATIYFTATAPTGQTDVFAIDARAGGTAKPLTSTPGRKTNLRLAPNGAMLTFSSGGGRGGGGGTPPAQGFVNLASGEAGVIEGASTAPAFSRDGASIAYISRSEDSSSLVTRTGMGAPRVILSTADRLDAPAFSPDGSHIVYQRMLHDDWELYVTDLTGETDTRLTREIQHDVLPRFLDDTHVMGLVGEARHRRSYVYDIATGAKQRLFHNNTVRTIAPEYIWDTTPDGTKVLIQADRDGNTVSRERGVYMVDLTKRITRDQLVARIDASLAAERSLRAFAARVTAPLATEIRSVLDRASVTRVFGYEKALYDFDSKHITQPGNAKASAYLHSTYASFGYTPEFQWFEPRGALGGRSANVLATLRGTVHPEVIYVVSSHYDSVAIGPGADDDSSGTAALLEAARIMAGHPQPATIVFASFTGEEAGLLGSREFVRQTAEAKWNVVGALNNDMIGWANDHRLDNTIRYSNPGIKDIQHAVALTFTNLITYDALYYRSTDAQAYYDAWGDIVGGIGSYPVLGNPHYHQSHDLLDTINHRLVTEVAKTTAATLIMLSNTPARVRGLTATSAGSGATLAWDASPEHDIREYVVTWQPAGGSPQRMVVTSPAAAIANAPAGTEVSVIAVNARGLEGWDRARAIVR
jgi:Tol biopolymer transport system component